MHVTPHGWNLEADVLQVKGEHEVAFLEEGEDLELSLFDKQTEQRKIENWSPTSVKKFNLYERESMGWQTIQ